MKKTIFGVAIATLFVSSLLMASVPVNKQHKGLTGKDGAKVNCTYCHKKAASPKTKGNDLAKLKKGAYCAIDGCHK